MRRFYLVVLGLVAMSLASLFVMVSQPARPSTAATQATPVPCTDRQIREHNWPAWADNIRLGGRWCGHEAVVDVEVKASDHWNSGIVPTNIYPVRTGERQIPADRCLIWVDRDSTVAYGKPDSFCGRTPTSPTLTTVPSTNTPTQTPPPPTGTSTATIVPSTRTATATATVVPPTVTQTATAQPPTRTVTVTATVGGPVTPGITPTTPATQTATPQAQPSPTAPAVSPSPITPPPTATSRTPRQTLPSPTATLPAPTATVLPLPITGDGDGHAEPPIGG